MTAEIGTFLAIFVVTLFLFAVEWVSVDIIAIGVMLALTVTGLLTPEDAFAGFGSETVIMIFGLLVLTEALIHNGVVELVGDWILQHTSTSVKRLTATLMVVPGLTSAFMSNTASTAFYLPITLGLARRVQINPAKLLMPLAFSTILASSVTLVATSTNIVVSGLMQQNGLAPLEMFELAPVGVPILLVGLLYMLYVGQHLIPERWHPDTMAQHRGLRLYVARVRLLSDSSWAGATIETTVQSLGLGALQLIRDGASLPPLHDTALEIGDAVVVEGKREQILKIREVSGVELEGDLLTLDEHLGDDQMRIIEVVILPGSPLIGRTIRGLRFRARFGLQILALYRPDEVVHTRIGRTVLHVGDMLLMQIPVHNIPLIQAEGYFHVLDSFSYRPRRAHQTWISVALFGGVMVVATLKLTTIAVAVMIGALLAFLTGAISTEDAYRRLQWRILILIGSMLAFGEAMQQSGTADYLAEQIINVAGDLPPVAVLSLFFWMSVLLTQPMSNQAAAATLVPIAIETATRLDADPRPFAVMIAVAASASYLTPLEPACVMVYGAGHYKFMDFVRVGALLTVLIFLVAIVLVPLIWPVGAG